MTSQNKTRTLTSECGCSEFITCTIRTNPAQFRYVNFPIPFIDNNSLRLMKYPVLLR